MAGIDISFWAVLVAAVVSFVIGFVWYHPKVFGTQWMGLVGMTPESMSEAQKGMGGRMVAAFVAQLVLAYILGYFLIAMKATGSFAGGAEVAAWLWLGFVATVGLGVVLWERKPIQLFLINSIHWLVAMVVAGGILSLML